MFWVSNDLKSEVFTLNSLNWKLSRIKKASFRLSARFHYCYICLSVLLRVFMGIAETLWASEGKPWVAPRFHTPQHRSGKFSYLSCN
jgi:hypothetical protein